MLGMVKSMLPFCFVKAKKAVRINTYKFDKQNVYVVVLIPSTSGGYETIQYDLIFKEYW